MDQTKQSETQPKEAEGGFRQSENTVLELVSPILEALGYDVVAVEVLLHRQKKLRIFIDHLAGKSGDARIGIEDCVTVSRALDEKLDLWPEIETIFKGQYELEVSSPGVDRPLRRAKDYERFAGQRARIHVFRPLTAEELGNADYQARNPKQKNFLGTLKGVFHDQVVLNVGEEPAGAKKKRKKSPDAELPGTSALPGREGAPLNEVHIPLALVSKANLEPEFDFGDLSKGARR